MKFKISMSRSKINLIIKLTFWQQWLLHALFRMVAIHVLDLFSYTYNTVYFSPNQLNDLPNFWERFRDGTYWIILFFTFLAEFGYQKIYVKKGIWAFLALSFFFGAVFSGLFYFTNVFLSDKHQKMKDAPVWVKFYLSFQNFIIHSIRFLRQIL